MSTTIRDEIAAHAARLIAEDGMDYAGAKRRAAQALVGDGRGRISSDMLPDNEQIEEEVRLYQQLFQSDTQPQRLAHLRKVALEIMRLLANFDPHLTGAVLNGTAGEHSDIRILLLTDSAKDVEIFLLNHNIDFDANETADARGRGGETLSFLWKVRGSAPEGVYLTIFDRDSIRHEQRGRNERASLATVEKLFGSENA